MKRRKQQGKNESIEKKRRRLLNNESPFAIREAYVKLRTSLMFCMTKDRTRQCKTFAVTSSNPSEGKSITAANIAISFSMLGKRVLLIDADLRKPTQRSLWGIEQQAGLCDFLAKIQPLELIKVQELPLYIACAGTIPPNPSELLSSEYMRGFMHACSEKYDYIIVDTPPVNTVADAQIIASFVDGIVMIARSGKTSSDELNAAIEAIEQVDGNLSGIVLNDLNMKSVRYSYKYKYGKYGHKYGYSYSYENTYGETVHD